MGNVYGYCRISTNKQSINRQIKNIKEAFPNANILEEVYTGTRMDRPVWKRIINYIKPGDTVVFDEISRMSRNAEEGFRTYEYLFNKNVNLIFLKERMLDTQNIKDAKRIAMTGTDVDLILEGINKYMLLLTKNQIKSAFATAQHEVDYLHQRTREGIAIARLNGKAIGHPNGKKNSDTLKKKNVKEIIVKHNKTFGGTLNDIECIKLCNICRNTYYTYKREIKEK